MLRTRGRPGYAMIVVAAVIVILGGMYAAAPFLSWLLLAVLFALLCYPPYGWMLRHGVHVSLALTLIALVLTAVVGALAVMVATSVSQILSNLGQYREDLTTQVANLNARLDQLGIAAPPNAVAGIVNVDNLMGWFAWLLGTIAGMVWNFFTIILMLLFLLADGPKMIAQMRTGLGDSHPVAFRLTAVGPKVIRYFGVRAYVNLLTGVGASIAFWLLGVDYAVLWGVLLFFLSFVPYIGIMVASVPPVLLALAEYGPERAILVIAGVTVVNAVLENLVMPRLVGSSLHIAPGVVFLSFFFWALLLGPSGALLASFLTVLSIALLDSYESTRWLARMMAGGDDNEQWAKPMAAWHAAPTDAIPDTTAGRDDV
jgi:AI-2 transport protein TqsA